MGNPPNIVLLTSPDWQAYELLDSGGGKKLERFGPYILSRPEAQALWKPALPSSQWKQAHAVFHPTGGESGGVWEFLRPMPPEWEMDYKGLKFLASTSGSRHMGLFPEQANHWDWIENSVRSVKRPVKVLNLFGYTGLASLAAARAGANVTHVDASKKSINTGQHNQELTNLTTGSIRWLVDDAFKFVQRELRRGNVYDGFILDPPKFGRGPQGQVWEFFESLTSLLDGCRRLFSPQPLFLVLTAYAIRASCLSVYYLLQDMLADMVGTLETGELVLVERSAGRMLSTAIYTRWLAAK
ncbi:MAG: SAM-dependent methyltransferase [Chloroflexi bacterium RBG_16_54_18]|nr:MAG: SAM-dependent methyltransferase [Chloroflexi bacterium RBG_16_54_18]